MVTGLNNEIDAMTLSSGATLSTDGGTLLEGETSLTSPKIAEEETIKKIEEFFQCFENFFVKRSIIERKTAATTARAAASSIDHSDSSKLLDNYTAASRAIAKVSQHLNLILQGVSTKCKKFHPIPIAYIIVIKESF